MPEWILAVTSTFVVGVLLLILEYRTGWFANHVPQALGFPKMSFNEQDWVETIYKVKHGLGKIYGVAPDEIEVYSWEPKDRNKKIRLEVNIPSRTGARWSVTHVVWAERGGRILRVENDTLIRTH
jgi:hypothetical protein